MIVIDGAMRAATLTARHCRGYLTCCSGVWAVMQIRESPERCWGDAGGEEREEDAAMWGRL